MNQDSNTNIFYLFHGGNKWTNIPTEFNLSTKGRYECGVGLYLTNNYNTARRYAKGSRVVQKVGIDSNYRDISTVKVELAELIDFIKNVPMMRKKKEIIELLEDYSIRTRTTLIPLIILNNLIVNYEAGSGNVGKRILNFFVEHGADAMKYHHSGDEWWFIVFNPNIIKTAKYIDPKTVDKSTFDINQIP